MSDENEEAKPSLLKRLLVWCLTSPVNVLFMAALLYYGVKGFVFKIDPMFSKMIMVGIAGLWLLWTVGKSILKLLLFLFIAAGLAYGWYTYTQRDARACEESGGAWNQKTKTCDEKLDWKQKIVKMYQEYRNK